MSTSKSNFWSSPLTKSRITSDDVKMPEMLLGYFIGPFGALLSSGIFTSILQNYFTDVLKLDLGFFDDLAAGFHGAHRGVQPHRRSAD